MKKENIVTRKWGDRRKGKTDWARVDALTDEDITKAIGDDPDWVEFKDIDWSDAVLVMPAKKKAISIRVDEDVLDFFKKEGDGYQRRINAVLRSYMQQKAKPKKRPKAPPQGPDPIVPINLQTGLARGALRMPSSPWESAPCCKKRLNDRSRTRVPARG